MSGTNRGLMAVLTALSLAACGNEVATSQRISATSGGTVEAGAHTLTIPPSALAVDTEVVLGTGSLSSYAPLEGARAEVIELSPEGTNLEVPATVMIGADFIGATAGQRVAIHQFRNVDGVEAWRPIEFELVSGGAAAVNVSVFAPLGVVVTTAPSTSTIEGSLVWGTTTDPVDGAQLRLFLGETMVGMTTTDTAGHFTFTGLEAGSYFVRGEHECAVNQGVTVPAGTTVSVTIGVCAAG